MLPSAAASPTGTDPRVSGSGLSSLDNRRRRREPSADTRTSCRTVVSRISAVVTSTGTLPGFSSNGGGKARGAGAGPGAGGVPSGVTGGAGSTNGAGAGAGPGAGGAITYPHTPIQLSVLVRAVAALTGSARPTSAAAVKTRPRI